MSSAIQLGGWWGGQSNVSDYTGEVDMSENRENREDTTENQNVNTENASSNQKQECAEVKW